MKILKYIFLLLVLCCVAAFVFVATQPGEYFITKSKEITVSKDIVSNFINDYKKWNLWNPNFDKSVSKEFFSDDLKNYTIKNGSQTTYYETIEQFGMDSLIQKMKKNDVSRSIVWRFKSTSSGTLVICEMKGTMNFEQKLYSILQNGVENYLGEELSIGIENISNYLSDQINTYSIKIKGIETFKSTFYIYQKDSCSISIFYTESKRKIPDLLKFAQQNSLTYINKPFVLFDYWNRNSEAKFSICLPVQEEIITSEGSDISGGEVKEFKALKISLTGDYSHVRKACNVGYAYIKKNKLIALDKNHVESYIVFAPEEQSPSRWMTDIYIPIKNKFARKKEIKVETETLAKTSDIPKNN